MPVIVDWRGSSRLPRSLRPVAGIRKSRQRRQEIPELFKIGLIGAVLDRAEETAKQVVPSSTN